MYHYESYFYNTSFCDLIQFYLMSSASLHCEFLLFHYPPGISFLRKEVCGESVYRMIALCKNGNTSCFLLNLLNVKFDIKFLSVDRQ